MLIGGSEYKVKWGYAPKIKTGWYLNHLEGGGVQVIDRGGEYDEYSCDLEIVGTKTELETLEALFSSSEILSITTNSEEQIFGADVLGSSFNVFVRWQPIDTSYKLHSMRVEFVSAVALSFKSVSASLDVPYPLSYKNGREFDRTITRPWGGTGDAIFKKNYTNDFYNGSLRLQQADAEKVRVAFRSSRGGAVELPNKVLEFFGNDWEAPSEAIFISLREKRISFAFWQFDVEYKRAV